MSKAGGDGGVVVVSSVVRSSVRPFVCSFVRSFVCLLFACVCVWGGGGGGSLFCLYTLKLGICRKYEIIQSLSQAVRENVHLCIPSFVSFSFLCMCLFLRFSSYACIIQLILCRQAYRRWTP